MAAAIRKWALVACQIINVLSYGVEYLLAGSKALLSYRRAGWWITIKLEDLIWAEPELFRIHLDSCCPPASVRALALAASCHRYEVLPSSGVQDHAAVRCCNSEAWDWLSWMSTCCEYNLLDASASIDHRLFRRLKTCAVAKSLHLTLSLVKLPCSMCCSLWLLSLSLVLGNG